MLEKSFYFYASTNSTTHMEKAIAMSYLQIATK